MTAPKPANGPGERPETTTPIYFPSAAAFRDWLVANHDTASELVVGFYRVATGRPTLTWSEAVDEALCVGWIDGIRRSVDAERYTHWLATHHYENFNVVSWLLPRRLHQHFYNLYAYCRWADDLACYDEGCRFTRVPW